MIALVTKSDGRRESFSRAKIARSVAAAGASKATAEEVASLIPARDIKSHQIRKMVYEALKVRNPRAARKYIKALKLKPVKGAAAAEGVAQLTLRNMVQLNIGPGDMVYVGEGMRERKLVAGYGTQEPGGVSLSDRDLESIGDAHPGKILVRRG